MYDRRPERGLADNDVRHNFIGSFVYELPFGDGKRFTIDNPVLNAVVGGWQVNGITNFRSGMPYTIGVANDLANVGTGNQRGNATGVEPQKLDPRTNDLLGLDRCGLCYAGARSLRKSCAQHPARIWHQQLGFLGDQEFPAPPARRSVRDFSSGSSGSTSSTTRSSLIPRRRSMFPPLSALSPDARSSNSADRR